MYVLHGVVPCVAVTAPLIGSVTDVLMYVLQGTVPWSEVTAPVTGTLMSEDWMLTGTWMDAVAMLMGRVVDVVTYVCIGWFIICACTAFVTSTGIVGFCTVTGIVPTAVTGSVTDVVTYVGSGVGMTSLDSADWSWFNVSIVAWSCWARFSICLLNCASNATHSA